MPKPYLEPMNQKIKDALGRSTQKADATATPGPSTAPFHSDRVFMYGNKADEAAADSLIASESKAVAGATSAMSKMGLRLKELPHVDDVGDSGVDDDAESPATLRQRLASMKKKG